MTLGMFVITYYISSFGKHVVAAHGIAIRIEQIFLLPSIGINVVVLAIISQNNGAKLYDRVKETVIYAQKVGFILWVFGIIFLLIFGKHLLGLFSSDAKVIDAGMGYLYAAASSMHAYMLVFINISLLIGIALGSLLSTLIPADMTSLLSDNLWLSYIFVLLISVPLYVCAITSIPIGITLILTGFSPGAAFVFLTAGPATSLITMSIVKKILGTKSLVIYLASVIIGTTIFAYFMDTTFTPYLKIVTKTVNLKENASLLEAISTVAMYLLFYKYIFPKKK